MEVKLAIMEEWLRGMTREELKIMGRKGLRVIEDHYTKDKITSLYVDLVDSLVK